MIDQVSPVTLSSPETPVFPGKTGLLDVFGDAVLLVALVGPPGSGKTNWREKSLPDVPVVHLDGNRAVLSPYQCEADQSVTAAAVHMAMAQAADLLAAGRSVVWDATNAVRAHRMALQLLAAEHGATTAAFVLLPELEVCLERNRRRNATPCPCGFARRVPDAAVTTMHADISRDPAAMPGEGWDVVAFADQLTGVSL